MRSLERQVLQGKERLTILYFDGNQISLPSPLSSPIIHNIYPCHPDNNISELNLSFIRRASMMPALPGRQREVKDVNILVDHIAEEDLSLSVPAKRRHSCVPGSYQLDPATSGRRYSAHIRETKS